MRDCVAHFHFRGSFDTGDDVTHIAGGDLLTRGHFEFENTYLVGVVLFAGVDKPHLVAGFHSTIDYFEIGDDAAEGVEYGVKDKALERCVRVSFGRRYTLDDGIQDLWHAFSGLGGTAKNLLAFAPQEIDNLVLYAFGHGVVHVAFIEHWNDLEVMLNRHIEIRDRLRLHALCGIHHKHGALARGDRTRDFITEVHVPRSVD